MWSGVDQLLFDGRHIPCANRSSNSVFAAASLSGGRRLAFDVTRGPVVCMQWVTVVIMFVLLAGDSTSSSLKSFKIRAN